MAYNRNSNTKSKGGYGKKSKGGYSKKATSSSTEKTGSKVAKIAVEQLYNSIFKNGENQAILPWQKPFNFDCMNWGSERTYKGFNFLYLSFVGSGEYITEAQLKKYNEEKGTDFAVTPRIDDEGKEFKRYPFIAVYWNVGEKTLSEATAKKLMDGGNKKIKQKTDGTYVMTTFSLIYHGVHDIKNIVDSKGNTLPSKIATNNDTTEFPDIEEILNTYMENTEIKIEENKLGRASHNRVLNIVRMPNKKTFKSNLDYFKTLAHELVHSTGVENRLNRKSLIDYKEDKKTRGQEELVAEYGSNLLLARCGLDIKEIKFDNSIDYIRDWCSWMRDNPDAFLKAVSDAEEAVEFILNGGYKIEKTYTEKTTESKEVAEKKKAPLKVMVNYFLRQSKDNDYRGNKCYDRAVINGNFEKLVDVNGLSNTKFKVIGHGKTGEPILELVLPDNSKLVCGFTFAIHSKSEEEYSVIYNVFNTSKLAECEERATKLGIPQLIELSKCVYLRGGGGK